MTGGYVFTGVCLSNFWGATPIWLTRGVPRSQVQAGGTPFPSPGGGYSFPGLEWGTPHLDLRRGYPPPPHLNLGRGTLQLDLGKGYPLPGPPTPTSRSGPRMGGYPQPEQHSVYLLRGGRYASCVHAGGLSCLTMLSPNFLRHLMSIYEFCVF